MYVDILTVSCLIILTCKCTLGKNASETRWRIFFGDGIFSMRTAVSRLLRD